jgi:uncharacterized protein
MAALRIAIIIVLVLAVAGLLLMDRGGPGDSSHPATTSSSGGQTMNARYERVEIGGEKFNLELAITDRAREDGLKHRAEIPADGGMLFIFPPSQIRVQRFWMHNCLTDMDIIYLDARGTVTAVHRMKAEPARRPGETEDDYRNRLPLYSSGYPAQFAIELRPGSLDRLKVRVEDKIKLDLPRLKAMAN